MIALSQFEIAPPMTVARKSELASEVLRVMNRDRLGPDKVIKAVTEVMQKAPEGYGEAMSICKMVDKWLIDNPRLLAHVKGNAPINSADAYAKWDAAQG